MNYLCISMDGLHSGMIGAYGNAWIHTPTLDALACQSVLFHRFYAATLDLSATFHDYWQFLPDCKKILLTDDTDVFLHEKANLFDERHRLEAHRRKNPAEKIEETQFFRGMATVADVLHEQNNTPFFFWAHFEGFRGNWDFPMSYRNQYQEEEDPDAYAGISPPAFDPRQTQKEWKGFVTPDIVQSVVEAYSGGITVLDETLFGLLTSLEEMDLAKNTMLIFVSVRGFSLGEHSLIGCTNDLYGENVQLPLFIRFPNGAFAGVRSQSLLQPADLFPLLQCSELPEEPNDVHKTLRIDPSVIVTPDWFLYKKPAGSELYVKPDDRWEANNVAERCPHVIEQLAKPDCLVFLNGLLCCLSSSFCHLILSFACSVNRIVV